MPEKMFIKLTGEDWGYTCHDEREHSAVVSLVPYVRDRVIHVLIEMVARGHDPYCLWGRRTLVQQLKMVAKKVSSLKQSRHLVGKAADIVDHGDLLTGGSGWDTAERFWADLIVVGTSHGLYSGFAWSKYGRFGDSCHLEYNGKALKLPVWLLRLASR